MTEQLSLYDAGTDEFYGKLQDLLDDIIVSHNLPPKSIHLYSNRGKTAGRETSKSICIFEPEYPPKENARETAGRNLVILNIKEVKDDCLELIMGFHQYNNVDVPDTAEVKIPKSHDKARVIFSRADDSVFQFIRENVLYCLATYESSSSFGCCDRFIACSDAGKCVHDNKIYSMGCKYRANLEAGRIFYGKNRNVD